MSSIFKPLTQETTPCPREPPVQNTDTSEFADLCLGWFWGPQYEFDRIEGIKSTIVGYAGGKTQFPTYKSIQDYTEAIRVEYDPKVLSYEQIIQKFFDMQGGPPSYGSFSRQYRSAILLHNAEQKAVVDKIFGDYAKKSGKKIYTDVEEATDFYRAEEYHQNYVDKKRRQ